MLHPCCMEPPEPRGNPEKMAEIRGKRMQHGRATADAPNSAEVSDFTRILVDARQGFEP